VGLDEMAPGLEPHLLHTWVAAWQRVGNVDGGITTRTRSAGHAESVGERRAKFTLFYASAFIYSDRGVRLTGR
jgi:hypothetical protein